jgi:hypothetical protein
MRQAPINYEGILAAPISYKGFLAARPKGLCPLCGESLSGLEESCISHWSCLRLTTPDVATELGWYTNMYFRRLEPI